jgi:ABC-type sugar transport system ATPase subunit
MEKEILRVKNITMLFPGVKALDDVELSLNKGEVWGRIGETGAGKSTLMNILLGIYTPSAGTMTLKNKPYAPRSPHDALGSGISMIHQEISLIPGMSVAENIWLGRENKFTRGGIINTKHRLDAKYKLLQQLDIVLNPNSIISTLSVANMQLVEVARAVSYESDIIVMDEPTSALTDVEIKKLYKIVNQVSASGTAVIYISHKLEELFEICNRITVMRDGKYITTKGIEEVTKDDLVSLMVGRDITNFYPKEQVEIGDVVFECKNLTKSGSFKNVSFSVRSGEILGFCGLIGSQRTEIMQSIFGLEHPDSGELYLKNKRIFNKSPAHAIKNHFAMVTEDRLRTGGIHMLHVKLNLSIAYLKHLCKFWFVNNRAEVKACNRMVEAMNIKLFSLAQTMGTLSGGNQQKVILGRWLLTEPNVMIFDEPTRGIDVGAKAEIYKLIGNMVKQGKAVIVISSELPEIMGISDRIIVVRNGEIAANIERVNFDTVTLMSYAFGVAERSVA